MASATLPTIVFLPGGWHSPECFAPVISILSSDSYPIDSVSFPSIGPELRNEKSHKDWKADVAAARKTVLEHLGKGEQVVLVVHSYSGTVGSEAVKGLGVRERHGSGGRGGVISLVYLTALALPVGGYIWESTGGKPLSPRIQMKGGLCYATDTRDWFYNECTPEQAAVLESNLRSHSWKTFLSPVTYQAWRHIRSVYLLCENDHAIPLAAQKAMIESTGSCFEVEYCDADHSPFQSRPERTADVIRKAANVANIIVDLE